MKLSLFQTIVLLGATSSLVSAVPLGKANEYKDQNCNQRSYEHWGGSLGHVTMDDSTHSVYLNSGTNSVGKHDMMWVAYDGKTSNGGDCTGRGLGVLPDGCVDLDNYFPNKRIRCVLNTPKYMD